MDVTTTSLQDSVYRSASRPIAQSLPRMSLKFRWVYAIEVLLDLLAVFSCVEVTLRTHSLKVTGLPSVHGGHEALIALVSSWIMLILLDRAGAYRSSGGLLRLRETASVVGASFLALMVLVPFVILLHLVALDKMVLSAIGLSCLVLILQKQLLHSMLVRLSGRGANQRVLIYGSDASARVLFRAFARSPKLGFVPVALVHDGTEEGRHETSQCAGAVDVLSASFSSSLVRQYKADMVVISSPFSSKAEVQHVIDECAAADARVAFGSAASSLGHAEIEYIELDGQLVYREHRVRTPWTYAFVSRSFDIVLSSAMLIFASIPLLIAAFAIRLETSGPTFFRQVRIGLNGVPFTIFKFRTMYQDSCGDGVSPADSRDPRITRVGKWLRRTSLDELPQLFNVLRGDMALVGPRPEMPFIVAGYSDHQRQRLCVKPGLTGIWQISADRKFPIHENLHYDFYYLKHRSIALDFAVMLHTICFAMCGV